MNWIRLSCRLGGEKAWELVARLESRGALGVTLLPLEADENLYEPAPGAVPLAGRLRLEALFDSRVAAENAANATGIAGHCSYETLGDRDWVAQGERGFAPQQYGERLWIVPEWDEAPNPDAVNVLIAPGLAFGTGTHPSTALCLEWLADNDLAGADVIDYGCGSGVLAIAAARLGAKRVTAVDNDPQACLATRANAQRNGVAITVGEAGELQMGQADVLVANILARPLIGLADELCARTRIGGRMVLAGIIAEQVDVVAAAYLPQARRLRQFRREQWCCIELRRCEG